MPAEFRSRTTAATIPEPAGDCYRTQAGTPTAGGDTRANTNAGVGTAFTRDVLVATGATGDLNRARR